MATRADKEKSAAELDGPRALRPRERPSALRLLNSSLRPDGPPNILEEYPLVLGEENSENIRVIVKGKEVVSHAAIYFSSVRAGELVFKVGGIGSVATDPTYRGQGLASAVMQDCIDIMREAGCHLSVLWTQRHDFYRNLGYEAAGSSFLFRAKRADFAGASRACDVVPYSPELLSSVIEIHERETLRTERTEKEYATYLAIPKTKILLAIRQGSVSAYAVMGKGEDLRNCVHDWGGNAQDLLCLVREFAAISDAGRIAVLAPARENEFTRLLERLGIPKIFDYLAMMRVIDIDGLSLLLRDYLGSRLGKDVRIFQGDSGPKMSVVQEEAVIENERTLVRVLFGPTAPSKLLRGLSHDTLSALDRALPIPLFIWGLDSV